MTRHWNEDDCIDRIYGVGRDDEHLAECAECRALWERVEARRTILRAANRGVQERVHVPRFQGVDALRPRMRVKLVPALAGAGVVAAAALLVIQPSPTKRPAAPVQAAAMVSPADAQFFDEVAALDQSPEPRAARTAEALFEDGEN